MENLVEVRGDDVFTNSKVIAQGTGNQHESVSAIIQKYCKDIEDFGIIEFSDLKSGNPKGGRPERIYYLNEEQATFVITLMRNNKIVVKFKKELVRQFYAMRRFIFERQSQGWIQTREQGKLTRKAETDVLKRLVEYAKEQGYNHKDNLLYINYTKLANKICGISGRDNASMEQLSNLTVAENIILHCIDYGIQENKYYKDIYQDCKKRLKMFKNIAYLEVVRKMPDSTS